MVQYEPLKRVYGTGKSYDRQVTTVCQECTVGCGLIAYVKDDRIVDVQGQEDHSISRGRLCPKGTAFVQGLVHPQRITIPAARNTLTRGFESLAGWRNALDQLAERLRRLRDTHGPDALIIGCDPEAGLDFYLGARRFARMWGTAHVYHPGEEPEVNMRRVMQTPVLPGRNWAESQCLLLVEADMAVTHPVAFGRILEAQGRGTKLIVADSRYTATMSKADLSLRIRPGSGNLLGLYLLKLLLEEGLENEGAVEKSLENSEDWRASYDQLDWEAVKRQTGITAEEIRNTGRYLARKHPSAVMTGKRLSYLSHFEIWPTLAAAMGWIGASGGGWYPLDAALPPLKPDNDIEDPPAPATPKRLGAFNMNGIQDIDPALAFRALIGSGNCLDGFFVPLLDRAAKMDLVVHYGSFPNESCQQAHMVIPAAHWAERDSLCFASDRTLQWAPKILAPADTSRSGLDFWSGLAERFGWEDAFPWKNKNGQADAFEFYGWLLKRSTQTAACDLKQLRDSGLTVRWPCDSGKPQAEPQPLFETPSGRIEPAIAPQLSAADAAGSDDENFPFIYHSTRIVSRSSDAANWWPWTAELEDINAIQIHPETARKLKIENGDAVVINSRAGCLEGRAWISRMVDRNTVWSPRPLPGDRVIIIKKGQSTDEALEHLSENTL